MNTKQLRRVSYLTSASEARNFDPLFLSITNFAPKSKQTADKCKQTADNCKQTVKKYKQTRNQLKSKQTADNCKQTTANCKQTAENDKIRNLEDSKQ